MFIVLYVLVNTSTSSTSSISLLRAEGQGQRALIPVSAETTALTGTKRWNVHEGHCLLPLGFQLESPWRTAYRCDAINKNCSVVPGPDIRAAKLVRIMSWSVSSAGSDLYLGMFCCWAIQKRALRTPLSILSNACIPDTRHV